MRAVALPIEHGGWGFLFEAVVLGLLVAPSWAGLLLGLATTALFLVHQPLRIAVRDHLNRRRVPRTRLAERFASGYLAVGLIAFALAAIVSQHPFQSVLLLALPFAGIQAVYDAMGRNRSALAEVTGVLALAVSSSMIVLAGGWTLVPALALWVLLSARAITTILYVRDRLRLERGKPDQRRVTLAVHIAALVVVGGLTVVGLLPWSAAIVVGILLARAARGLSRFRRSLAPRLIGRQEIIYSVLLIAASALGYALL